MITYDIYKVTYTGKKPNCNLSEDDIRNLLMDNGSWEHVSCYKDGSIARHLWNNKWMDMAETEENEYNSKFLDYTMIVFERTERDDESEEPFNSIELDCAIEEYYWYR